MRQYQKSKGISLILIAMGVITLLSFAALAVDLGSMLNIQNELEKAARTATLAGASQFNPLATEAENLTAMTNAAQNVFNLTTDHTNDISGAQIVGNVETNTQYGATAIKVKCNAPTYFIKMLGITTIEVNAEAAALYYPTAYKIMNNLNPIPTPYQKPTLAFAETRDPAVLATTAVDPTLDPSATATPDPTAAGAPDPTLDPTATPDPTLDPTLDPTATTTAVASTALISNCYSLGTAGKLQLVGILPIVNGNGPEIIVDEDGDLEGYFVFVATDAAGPWYNITEKGVPLKIDDPGVQPVPLMPLEIQRFFGSGTFDLDGTGVENARYLAIVDDGIEDGYLAADKATLLDDTSFPGASSADAATNPGADIDGVQILQHSMSVQYGDFLSLASSPAIYDILIGSYDMPGKMIADAPIAGTVSPTAAPLLATSFVITNPLPVNPVDPTPPASLSYPASAPASIAPISPASTPPLNATITPAEAAQNLPDWAQNAVPYDPNIQGY